MSKQVFFENSYENTVHAENICFSAVIRAVTEDKNSKPSFIERSKLENMHKHAYTELFICFDSGINIKTLDRCLHLSPGELLVIPPGIVHTKLPSNSKWASIAISYSKINAPKCHSFFEKIDKLCKKTAAHILELKPETEAALHGLLYKYDVEKSATALEILSMLEILLRISTSYQAESIHDNSSDGPYDRDVAKLFRLEEILSDRFVEGIRPREAAQMLFISERQLTRIIQKNFGMSFHELITEYRIKTACQMLCNTKLTAEAVGSAVGFNNKSAFYTAFKKKVGVTPLEYRKMNF